MKRRFWLPFTLAIGLTVAGACVFGQGAGQQPSEETETHNEPDFTWHLINTGIFAVLVVIALAKLGPAFFNARSTDIQKAIEDATGLKIQADFRSSEIDRQMATLPEEVKRMREQAQVEMAREHERRKAETAAEVVQIQASLASEIDGMRAEGAQQIRETATRVAFRLAEGRLRDRLAGGDREFAGDFSRLVERGHTR